MNIGFEFSLDPTADMPFPIFSQVKEAVVHWGMGEMILFYWDSGHADT